VSKLYDQLKSAARARRELLEGDKAKGPAADPGSQKVLAESDEQWREEIEQKLLEADRHIINAPDAPRAPRWEESYAAAAAAAKRRAEVEARALEKAKKRAESELALRRQSERLALAEERSTALALARREAEDDAARQADARAGQERLHVARAARRGNQDGERAGELTGLNLFQGRCGSDQLAQVADPPQGDIRSRRGKRRVRSDPQIHRELAPPGGGTPCRRPG